MSTFFQGKRVFTSEESARLDGAISDLKRGRALSVAQLDGILAMLEEWGDEKRDVADRIVALQEGIIRGRITKGARKIPGELVEWLRGRDSAFVEEWEARKRDASTAMSGAERVAKHVAAQSDITELMHDVVNPERKESCRYDLLKFGLTYCIGEEAPLKAPPSDEMVSLILELQNAILGDALVHVRWPRGRGKTSWLEVGYVWAASYGHRQWLTIFSATAATAESIRNDIWEFCEFSEEFHEDFPEIAVPIRALEGRFQRCPVQKCNGKLTRITRKGNVIVFPTIEGSDASGVIITSAGRESRIRGMVRRGIRPDFFAVDDPQTIDTAYSPISTGKIVKWLLGDVMGLGGKRQISGYLTTTPICNGDFSELLADKELYPQWRTISKPLILSYPERKDLWEEYLRIRAIDENVASKNFKRATLFYRENREEMDRGAKTINDNYYDSNELSAIQHAYNKMFKMGLEGFEAECQLSPKKSMAALRVTAKDVWSKVNGVPPFVIPKQTHSVVACVDCHSVEALRWVIMAIGTGRVASVIGYGRYPETGRLFSMDIPKDQQNSIMYGVLNNLVGMIFKQRIVTEAGEVMPLSGVGIDRGWMTDIVDMVCLRSPYSGMLFPTRGFGWEQYAPERANGKPRDGVMAIADHCHLAQGKRFRYLGIHVDYWKEYMQRAWMAVPLTAGSLTVYGKEPEAHVAYAGEIVAEVLADHGMGTKGTEFWKWNKKPNTPNHWLDATSNCLALATILNLFAAIPQSSKDVRKAVERKGGGMPQRRRSGFYAI